MAKEIIFDFDYYTKIIDYINDSTQITNQSLNDLVNNYLNSRKKISIQVPLFSKTYKNVKIGGCINITPYTNKWIADSDIELELKNNKLVLSDNFINVDFNDNSIVLKNDLDKYINKLSKEFIFKQLDNITISAKYDNNTTDKDSFEDKQIPSIKWFNNNFYTKSDKQINFLIKATSNDENNKEQVVTEQIGDQIASVNIKNKTIDIYLTESLNTNMFKLSSDFLQVEKDTFLKVSNIETINASLINSVVTNTSLLNEFVLKDFSNLKKIYVVESDDQNSIINSNIADKVLNEKGCSYYYYFNIKKDTINNIDEITDKKVGFSKVIEETQKASSIKELLFSLTGVSEDNNKVASMLLIYLVSGFKFDKDIDYNKVSEHVLKGVPANLSTLHFIILLLNNVNGFVLWDNNKFKRLLNIKGFIYDKDTYKFNSSVFFSNPEDLISNYNIYNYIKQEPSNIFTGYIYE